MDGRLIRHSAPYRYVWPSELGLMAEITAEPYERLLHAALAGDHQLFARQDSVEETWRIVQPLLDHPPDVRLYPRGSWGPDDAEALSAVIRAGSHRDCPPMAEPQDLAARNRGPATTSICVSGW